MRTKLIAIVAILWVAAVGAVSIVLYATRPLGGARSQCYPQFPGCGLSEYDKHRPVKWYWFDWSTWWTWMGGLTLAALAAVAIVLVVTRKSD